MKNFNIVADDHIPLAQEIFSTLGKVNLLPGRKIKAANIENADILLVRSTTRIDKELLKNSPIKFVGTATAGTEHIDLSWLEHREIGFASAKGCNATAVAEYVVAVIAWLRQQKYFKSNNLYSGVIGIGHVGSKVVEKLQLLGFSVLQNDPPRANQDSFFSSMSLDAFRNLDLICIHTPLSHQGPFPSFHLLEQHFFQNQKKDCILLNAGRGAVINSKDLHRYGNHLIKCFDVWEHEPYIDLLTLKTALLATPHIAGYTQEAKLRGTLMLFQAVKDYFQLNIPTFDTTHFFHQFNLTLNDSHRTWEDVVLAVYNPAKDTQKMKQLLLNSLEVAEQFDELRKQHPKRFEFGSIVLKNANHLTKYDFEILRGLGFRIKS